MKTYYIAPEAELIRFQAAQAIAAEPESGDPVWTYPEEDNADNGEA